MSQLLPDDGNGKDICLSVLRKGNSITREASEGRLEEKTTHIKVVSADTI